MLGDDELPRGASGGYKCPVAKRRDATGSVLGLLVFLAGVGLLGLTFKLAYDEFSIPHAKALNLVKGQAIDPGATGGRPAGRSHQARGAARDGVRRLDAGEQGDRAVLGFAQSP